MHIKKYTLVITSLILAIILLSVSFIQCNCQPNTSLPNQPGQKPNPPSPPKPLLTEITDEMIQVAQENYKPFLAQQLKRLQKEGPTNNQIPYINDTDSQGMSALEAASSIIYDKHPNIVPDIVKALLERGAKKVNQALFWATASMPEKNEATISILLDAGANPIGDQSYAPWPLYQVIGQDGTVNVVKLMLAKIANINIQNADLNTPLHIAVEASNEKVIALLLNQHANPNIANKWGKTPREIAEGKTRAIKDLFGLP